MYRNYNNVRKKDNGGCGCGCGVIIIISFIIFFIISGVSAIITLIENSDQTFTEPTTSFSQQEEVSQQENEDDLYLKCKDAIDSCFKAIQTNDYELFDQYFSEKALDELPEGATDKDLFNAIRNDIAEHYGDNITLNIETHTAELIEYRSIKSIMIYCCGVGTGSKTTSSFSIEFIFNETENGWEYILVEFQPTENSFVTEQEIPSEYISSI